MKDEERQMLAARLKIGLPMNWNVIESPVVFVQCVVFLYGEVE